ncbi:RNA polymerase sigma factor SigJ [Paenibacillus lemnae]|uniref:RNA polymerase sigma factor SigJ n=1 Tax=Paenibacillus lemnae TaxID=1330551 RepID=A0A848M3N5_PAELE|nr:RNA polymerase sigma factor SigJ [Paenibacillus lemnae]
MEIDSAYRTYRPLLLSIGYRMLGSVTQTEDLVQDVFMTLQQQNLHQEEGGIRSLKSYLCKMVTNRCLDYMKSASHKREVYVGPWLPEPLVQDVKDIPGYAPGQDPLQKIVLEDTISYAFMVMLERLTPIERAVFILREAFQFEYRDIADFVDKSELGCRKIYSRLKRKIGEDRHAAEPSAGDRSEQLVLQFLHAASTGDMDGLFALLADDIVLYSDGGGKVLAAIKPVTTSKRVLAFIQGLLSKERGEGAVRLVKINGQLGFVISSSTEKFPTIVSLDVKGGTIQHMYMLRNPDKMQHLNLG